MALTDDEKVDFLARIAWELTIVFRDVAYTQPQTPENLKKMQGINELQHQLIQQLSKHHRRDERRYDDTSFVKILLEHAESSGLLPQVQHYMERGLIDQTS